MAKYINMDDLLEDIEHSVVFTLRPDKPSSINAELRGANKIIDRIRCAPAAEVVEVRHGRWILKDKSALDRKPKRGEEIFCDQCGEMALGYPFWECDLKPSNFCPNCGAKMDGGVNDEHA